MRSLILAILLLLGLSSGQAWARHGHDRDGWSEGDDDYPRDRQYDRRDRQDSGRDERRYERRYERQEAPAYPHYDEQPRYAPRRERVERFRGWLPGFPGSDRRQYRDNAGQGYLIEPRRFEGGGGGPPGMSPDEAADRAQSQFGGDVLSVSPTFDGGRRSYRVKLLSRGRVRIVNIDAGP